MVRMKLSKKASRIPNLLCIERLNLAGLRPTAVHNHNCCWKDAYRYINIVRYCQSAFGFHSVRKQVLRRKINFLAKLNQCENSLCSSLTAKRVASELLLLRTQLCVSAILTLIECILSTSAYAYAKSGVCLSLIISTYILLYFIIVFRRWCPSGEYSFIYKAGRFGSLTNNWQILDAYHHLKLQAGIVGLLRQ